MYYETTTLWEYELLNPLNKCLCNKLEKKENHSHMTSDLLEDKLETMKQHEHRIL